MTATAPEAGTPGAGPTAAGRPDADATPLDTIHDLVAQLVPDRDPDDVTTEVVLRATARRADGLDVRLDERGLLGSTITAVVTRARLERGDEAAAAVTDLAVLDLTVRHGLGPRTVSRITGVPWRALHTSRADAAARLATATDTTPAEAARRRAAQPADPAPAELHERLGPLLAARAPRSGPWRRRLQVGVILAATAAALVALAIWTPRLVDVALGEPATISAEPVDDEAAPTTAGDQAPTVAVDDEAQLLPVDPGAGGD